MKRLVALLCAVCLMAGCAFGGRPAGAPAGTGSAAQDGADGLSGSAPEGTPDGAAAPEPTPADEVPRDRITGRPQAADTAARPVAVMLRNTPAGYPHWGISGADALVEGISEGKIPSLMAIYSHTAELPRVGPVGEGRDPLLQLAMPSNAIVMQIGSNVYASNLLNLARYQPLDGYYIGVTSYDFDRDRRAAGYRNEFCWYTKESLLQDGLQQYGMSAAGEGSPLFAYVAEGLPGEDAAQAVRVEIGFSAETTAVLEYLDGSYRRYAPTGDPYVDADTGAELRFDKVILLQCAAGVKDDGYTRDYSFTQGTGLYLAGGRCLPMQWQKGAPDQPLRLYDLQGQPMSVIPGKTYIAIYGGFAGQSLRVLDAAGLPQSLPQPPAPLATAAPTPEPTPEPLPPEGGVALPPEGGTVTPPEGGVALPPEGGEPTPEG